MPMYSYPAGTWGPEEADILIAKHKNSFWGYGQGGRRLNTFSNFDDLANSMSDELCCQINAFDRQRKSPVIALSGGTTLVQCIEG